MSVTRPEGAGAPRGASPDFDVLIVGGGAVGMVLAMALATLPLRIGVVEASPPQAGNRAEPPSPLGSIRCTALAAASQRILATLGVWPAVRGLACAITEIHVSDRGRFGTTRLSARREAVDALGYVVENDAFVARLWQQLQAQAGPGTVVPIAPAQVTGVNAEAHQASLEIREADGASTRRLSAALLVGTDGARSTLRRLLAVDSLVHDYRQHAIVANVVPGEFHDHRAFERFTTSGPLALLPLTGQRCNLVWTVWRDDVSTLLALEDDAFLDALQQAFGYRLGRLQKVGPRRSFPLLRTEVPMERLPPRVVLAGNAATGVHPVAGQGLNLGLRDAAGLAEVIAEALSRGQADVGADAITAGFFQARAADRARVLAATDALVRVFTQPALPVRLARGIGLIGLELLPAAKSAFARSAMGYAGHVPRLARGLTLAVPAARDGAVSSTAREYAAMGQGA